MGREIRRVPKGWQHPRDGYGNYRPMLDQEYQEAARKWWEAAVAWQAKPAEERECACNWYWEYEHTPNEDFYRPAFTAPADHYQIYETVSEGTPVSPVFASLDEMKAWLTKPIDRGSEWNDGLADWQCMQGMTPDQAERFCEDGSSVSIVVEKNASGVKTVAGHKM